MKSERNILIAFLLNMSFSILELIGGIFTNSVAILSDSVHDLGDAMSIGISYILEKISNKKPNDTYTYGYKRYSVIGSVITTTILLVGSIFVIYESIRRILNPVDINYSGMLLFSIFGVIVNLIASYVTKDGKSLNQQAVNLHMLEDVLGWIVVLIGSVIMIFTNISIIDPILSICVAIFIFIHALKNLKEVIDVFLETTPKDVDLEELKSHLLNIKGVENIHHIHIRSLDGFNNIATLHVVVKKYDKDIKHKVKKELKEHGIEHSTIEIELEEENCTNKECKIGETKASHHHH